MHADRFDALTRRTATRAPRRTVLRAMLAGVAGLLVGPSAATVSAPPPPPSGAPRWAPQSPSKPPPGTLCSIDAFRAAGRECGAMCCSPLETCCDGLCVLSAGSSGACEAVAISCAEAPTLESLQLAAESLATGAEEVALSPSGCLRYRRSTLDDGSTYEALIEAGRAVEVWWQYPYGPNLTESLLLRDEDGDGFAELRVHGVGSLQREFTWISYRFQKDEESQPSNYYVAARETVHRPRWTANTVEILLEEFDAQGQTIRTEETTTSPYVSAAGVPNRAVIARAQDEGGPCTPVEEALIRQRLDEALVGTWDGTSGIPGGITCLTGSKNGPLVLHLARFFIAQQSARRRVVITCADTLVDGQNRPVRARTTWYALFWNDRIVVNRQLFFSDTPEGQRSTMFHEAMHPYLGWHDSEEPEDRDRDPIYACEKYCFGDANRCNCETCLKIPACMAPCCSLPDCVESWKCPCPGHEDEYDSEIECAVNCPSGLRCFGNGKCALNDRCT